MAPRYWATGAARIGLGEQTVTTKALRRRFFSLVGRLTRSARRLILHLPQRWPWQEKFGRALPGSEPFHSQPDDGGNRPPSDQLNAPANSRQPGPRAPTDQRQLDLPPRCLNKMRLKN